MELPKPNTMKEPWLLPLLAKWRK